MPTKDEWKCVTVTDGDQCVMMPSAQLMLKSPADSWDSPLLVLAIIIIIATFNICTAIAANFLVAKLQCIIIKALKRS